MNPVAAHAVLYEFGPEVWTAEGRVISFWGFRYPTRMALIRLSEDGLFVWSPLALSMALKEEVKVLAAVCCIVFPNRLHHLFLAERKVFDAERPKLVPYVGRLMDSTRVLAAVSKTCLVRFDNNKYSVTANAVRRPVEVFAYADRIVVRQDGRVVGEHRRSIGRGETIYDPWHYVPVLARQPGALRNGAPFKDCAAGRKCRCKLAPTNDSNRQTVNILIAALTDGLPAAHDVSAARISLQ